MLAFKRRSDHSSRCVIKLRRSFLAGIARLHSTAAGSARLMNLTYLEEKKVGRSKLKCSQQSRSDGAHAWILLCDGKRLLRTSKLPSFRSCGGCSELRLGRHTLTRVSLRHPPIPVSEQVPSYIWSPGNTALLPIPVRLCTIFSEGSLYSITDLVFVRYVE